MVAHGSRRFVTPEEFLDIDHDSEFKSEYDNGFDLGCPARLLRAAASEGLHTINPETILVSDLHGFLARL